MWRYKAIDDRSATCTSTTAATSRMRVRGALREKPEILTSDANPEDRFL